MAVEDISPATTSCHRPSALRLGWERQTHLDLNLGTRSKIIWINSGLCNPCPRVGSVVNNAPGLEEVKVSALLCSSIWLHWMHRSKGTCVVSVGRTSSATSRRAPWGSPPPIGPSCPHTSRTWQPLWGRSTAMTCLWSISGWENVYSCIYSIASDITRFTAILICFSVGMLAQYFCLFGNATRCIPASLKTHSAVIMCSLSSADTFH